MAVLVEAVVRMTAFPVWWRRFQGELPLVAKLSY